MSNTQQYLQTVALRDVKCYAFHGYYPEEHLTGIYFLVDVKVSFPSNADTENIDSTVNYEFINQVIMEEMAITRKMLETVVSRILNRVVSNYNFITIAEVSIKKLNPPMPGEVGHSFVQLSYTK
ncbi:dihydroneopterin aldolase [Pedobacter sp. UYP24]